MIQLDNLFQIQFKLDQKIIEQHQLHDQRLLRERCMALQVEVAELANETRVFKFWSLKPSSPRETVLEEYVDGLHFLLSIGLEKGADGELFRHSLALVEREVEESVFNLFEKVFQKVNLFAAHQERQMFHKLFQTYIDLGQALQFSWDDIKQAYLHKNQINHQRQEQGY